MKVTVQMLSADPKEFLGVASTSLTAIAYSVVVSGPGHEETTIFPMTRVVWIKEEQSR